MATGWKGDGAADPTTAQAELHAFAVADRLRSLPRNGTDPLIALATNAVLAVASRRGVTPPDLSSDTGRVSAGLDQLLADEDRWLQSAPLEQLSAYLPALARALAAIDQPGARERITSTALVDVIATIVSARPPEIHDRVARVFDPAAGTGTLLLRVAQSLDPQTVFLCGQEINEAMSLIASANAFLADVDARFVLQDALAADGFPDDSFDLAVSDPPYGLSWARLGESLADDPRYAGGFPRRSDSSLLFAQILASKLRPADEGGGRAVMLCAPSPLSESSGSSIREWFLERDLIEAVVALPEGLSSETNIRLFALVLSNSKPKGWTGKVQVVDLRGSYVDASKGRPERRRLSDAGLAELRRAIERLKPSSVARPVTLDHFQFNTVDIAHTAVARQSRGNRDRALLSARVPRHRTLEDWAHERYGVGAMPELSLREGEGEVRLDVSTAFPDPLDREAPGEIRRLGWRHTRLVCLATGFGFIRSAGAADRDSEIAAFPIGMRYLAIPVEPHLDAVVIDSLDAAPDSRCFIVDTDFAKVVDLSFVAAWLNSPGGRAARRSAMARVGAVQRGSSISIRTLSKAQIAQFVDDVIVPVPSMDVQQDIALTTMTIASAARTVSAAVRDLWQDPTNLHQLRRRIQITNEPEGLAEWARRLPYPLAGALWVYETEKYDPLKAQGHLLRFWEATAEFLATVFLSVLEGDPVLRASEFSTLRGALTKADLSLERATFGTWATIAQRLGATFRNQLDSEAPDAAEKVLQLFADPPSDVLTGLLSADVGRLLSRVNSLRNDWLGHAGATTDAQAREHLEVLVDHTEELRDLLASVWDQYRLVRAGRMARRDGRFHIEVELARGPTAPFRRKEIVLAEPLDEGRLYLTVLDGERALPLNDLIVVRAAPRSASYTCYFYSRREESGIRMVAYQYADKSSVVEEVPGIRRLLADFAAQTE